MCDSPGFTKPTHGYGQVFGDQLQPSADELLGVTQERNPSRETHLLTDDERDYEDECNLCPTPCSGCEKWERRSK